MSDQKAGSDMGYWIILVLVSLLSTLLMGLFVSCLDPEKLAFLENLALRKRIRIFQTSNTTPLASGTELPTEGVRK
jgi:hypothetical protein